MKRMGTTAGHRITAFLLAMILALSMMPFGVFAANSVAVPDVPNTLAEENPAALAWSQQPPQSVCWTEGSFTSPAAGGFGTGAITYTSTDAAVADVDENGKVTLYAPGSVTITATKAADGENEAQSISYTLNVTKATQVPLSFRIADPEAISYGETFTNVAEGGSVAGTVTYSVNDPSVADVDENGTVTPKKQGVVTVKATMNGNALYESVSASYSLAVLAAQQSALVFERGEEDQTVVYGQPYVNPVISGNATGPIQYTTSDASIATVDPATGAVTAKAAGTVIITATAPATEQYAEQTASYSLIVKRAEQTVVFAKAVEGYVSLIYGQGYQNAASAKTGITYTSSTPSVVEVNASGALIVHASGEAVITATAAETAQYNASSATYTVKIGKADQTVTFEKGTAVTVTFNDNNNVFVNTATSTATGGSEEDKKDMKILYSIVSGAECVDGEIDPATGSFRIGKAGSVTVKVEFSANHRYNAVSGTYVLTIQKDSQSVAFSSKEYSVILGSHAFQAPKLINEGEGSGSVVYSITEDKNGVASAIDPATGALTFTGNVGDITVKATKAEDDNYLATETNYTLHVNEWKTQGEHFEPDGVKINNSGWFVSNVSIVAKEGYSVSLSRLAENAVWSDSLKDIVTADGTHTVKFYIRDNTTGYISQMQQIEIRKDQTAPGASVSGAAGDQTLVWESALTVSKNTVTLRVDGKDDTSRVAKTEYYITENTAEILNDAALAQVKTWTKYNKPIEITTDKVFVLYAKITDTAGNCTYARTNCIVVDKSAIPAESVQWTAPASTKGFYNGDVTLDLRISDEGFTSGIRSVEYEILNNGQQTCKEQLYSFSVSKDTPYTKLAHAWEGTVTVPAAANNSDRVVVKCTVTDHAGNVTVKEISLKICITKPVMTVTFVDDPQAFGPKDGITYFKETRTARIEIKERASVFSASDKPVIKVTHPDGKLASVTTYSMGAWSSEGDVHTLEISFTGSARYTFTVDYADIFGEKCNFASEKFSVDTDIPTASVSVDEIYTWDSLMSALTFGLWKNESVSVTAKAADGTSPIQSLQYYVSQSTKALTAEELENVSWTEYSVFTLPADGVYTVYVKAVDTVGHVKYISSNGYVVDTAPAVTVLTPDQPNENGIYKDNFKIHINVTENTPYSGIKSVEYWVVCDEEKETHRETLYTFGAQDPTYEELIPSFEKDIEIIAAENNSDHVVVFVKVVDNAGNESVYRTQDLRIDTIAPVIQIQYDNNDVNTIHEGRGYFSADRVATIRFTERTSSFDQDEAIRGIVFAGTDVNGADVALDRSAMIEWIGTEENTENPDAAVHTVRVSFTKDANYTVSAHYTDKAGNASGDVIEADGTVAPFVFTVDKIAPDAKITVDTNSWNQLLEILTFGIFKSSSVSVDADASDKTSPLKIFYYKTAKTDLLTQDELDKISSWRQFEAFEIHPDEVAVVYLKVQDYAGNCTYINSDGHVLDKEPAVIVLTLDSTDREHDGVPLYISDVQVDIEVEEKTDRAYSGIRQVEYWVICEGTETQREVLYSFGKHQPEYKDLMKSFHDIVTIDAAANNSCRVTLYVGVTDNAGNYAESNVSVDIDITDPTIEIQFDHNNYYKVDSNNKGFYSSERVATVIITERTEHFDPSDVQIKITAESASGNTVIENTQALVGKWTSSGSGEWATHSATIDFTQDANYTFDIQYSDIAGNIAVDPILNNASTPWAFVVDTTAPGGVITAGNLGSWEELVEELTFGIWTKDEIALNVTSYDTTTFVESVSYYRTADTTGKTVSDLALIEEWTLFDEEITVDADERLVMYVRITDGAGNVAYISTNGMILDNTDAHVETAVPTITVTPEGTKAVYNTDVTVAVKVSDPAVGTTKAYSGIREIGYTVFNMGEITQQGVLFSFDGVNTTFDKLTQVWEKTDAIVVNKELNNSNDVKIVVYAVDNAGNRAETECAVCIDITAPVITVSYDNNSGDTSFENGVFFRDARTATITVTERNFDPKLVELHLTNTDGYIPQISSWTVREGSGNGDDTTHTAHIVFDKDGDYTFAIASADAAGNRCEDADYQDAQAPQAFTVDRTAPVVKVVYDNNNAANGTYYKAARTATVTVTEHNFETTRIRVKLEASVNGESVGLPVIGEWITNGDVHTATISYTADADYVFDFDYQDKAGNASADMAEHTFCVDTTEPAIEIHGVLDESANNDAGNIGFTVTVTDVNLDAFEVALTAVVRNGDLFETKKVELGSYTDIPNGREYTVANLVEDGIYRITAAVSDRAGNTFTKVTLDSIHGGTYEDACTEADTLVVFSVNREGSTFELNDSIADVVKKKYIRNLTENIVVEEINVDSLTKYTVILNDRELVKDRDYQVTEEGGKGAWMKYTYTVSRDLFEDEGEYKLVVVSRDRATNDAFSDVKDAVIAFVVDRTAPQVTVSGLAENGRYQTEQQKITLIPTDDGGALYSMSAWLVDEEGNTIRELVSLSGQAFTDALEENDGRITFAIDEGLYQNVRIVCSDMASEEANTYDMTFKNVSVSSSLLMIFWANKPLRWGTIGGVVAAGAAAVIVPVMIKKKRKEN